MGRKDYGSLEYSYTKGFNENTIINFYIDQKLRIYTRLKKEDRISVAYDFVSDKGIIVKVNNDLPNNIKKTNFPKLSLSSSVNENGKLKVWFEMSSDWRDHVLLPFIFHGLVPLRINEAREGYISFSTGKKTTIEQMGINLFENYLSSGIPTKEETHNIQEEIRKIKNQLLQTKEEIAKK